MTSDFQIEEPRSLDDALELLSAGDDTVRAVGGGTGLTLLMRYGFFEPTCLVSLRRLPAETSSVSVDGDGTVRIGAMATLRDVEDSADVAAHAPVVTDALSRLASIRVRNVATLGGALAHGHPQMDLPPVLMALDARLRIQSRSAERWLPVEELILGYYETSLGDDELITEVAIPPAPGTRASYSKVVARTADDWPALGVAVRGGVSGDTAHGVRIAVGAVTDRPQRLPAAEGVLEQHPVSEETVRGAAEEAADGLDYHDGPDGSAEYQRELVRVYARRTIERVLMAGADLEGA